LHRPSPNPGYGLYPFLDEMPGLRSAAEYEVSKFRIEGRRRFSSNDFPDRSKINMNEDYEVHYWTKHLNISKEELQKIVDKVDRKSVVYGQSVDLCGT